MLTFCIGLNCSIKCAARSLTLFSSAKSETSTQYWNSSMGSRMPEKHAKLITSYEHWDEISLDSSKSFSLVKIKHTYGSVASEKKLKRPTKDIFLHGALLSQGLCSRLPDKRAQTQFQLTQQTCHLRVKFRMPPLILE